MGQGCSARSLLVGLRTGREVNPKEESQDAEDALSPFISTG